MDTKGRIGVADAARNNAAWCDAVCSAHGAPGEWFDAHWLTQDAGAAVLPESRDPRTRSGAVDAGVTANRTDTAVGLSNFFVHGKEPSSARAECIDAAADVFPGLPLVGYETGQDLAASRALGFSSLGSLRVWIQQA